MERGASGAWKRQDVDPWSPKRGQHHPRWDVSPRGLSRTSEPTAAGGKRSLLSGTASAVAPYSNMARSPPTRTRGPQDPGSEPVHATQVDPASQPQRPGPRKVPQQDERNVAQPHQPHAPHRLGPQKATRAPFWAGQRALSMPVSVARGLEAAWAAVGTDRARPASLSHPRPQRPLSSADPGPGGWPLSCSKQTRPQRVGLAPTHTVPGPRPGALLGKRLLAAQGVTSITQPG